MQNETTIISTGALPDQTILLDTNYIDLKDIDAKSLEQSDYLLISGGDGSLRRVIKRALELTKDLPPIIINPSGSFNVVAKKHKVVDVKELILKIKEQKKVTMSTQDVYAINDEIFLFSAGNMGDLHHIVFSEMLRFGFLKNGFLKYLLAFLLLLPAHIFTTPFMLFSKRRFFIFTPLRYIKRVGNFYSRFEDKLHFDLENGYNIFELDGDIVTIKQSSLTIRKICTINIATTYFQKS